MRYLHRTRRISIAVLHALLTGDFCGPQFAAVAAKQLVKHNVRFLAGVFSDPAKLQNLCDATGRAHFAMFQAWWKPPMFPDAQQQVVESDAAVAARLGLESEDDVCKYGLYPAYLIVFGPCSTGMSTASAEKRVSHLPCSISQAQFLRTSM